MGRRAGSAFMSACLGRFTLAFAAGGFHRYIRELIPMMVSLVEGQVSRMGGKGAADVYFAVVAHA